MKKLFTSLCLSLLICSAAHATESLLSIESALSSKATADKFESILKNKGLTLFARIDHQQNAAGIDLTLRETELFIFGNPKVGTPIMQCSQQAAIDLPQKMLIWTDEAGKVWLSYNNPEYIKARHQVTGCDAVIDKVSGVLKALATAAASK